MKYILLVFLSFNILSEPWLHISDQRDLNTINSKLMECKNWDKNFISYPISLGEINFYIEKIKKKT